MIHIITPCSRPNNLAQILDTIPAGCSWTVVLDSSVADSVNINAKVIRSLHTGNSGNELRNQGMTEILPDQNDWVYFLDDDNLIHPDWFDAVSSHLNDEFDMLAWGQLNKDGGIRLPPPFRIQLNCIDTASFMVKWKALKNYRWETAAYDADGRLAINIASKHKYKTLDQYLCWYNALR